MGKAAFKQSIKLQSGSALAFVILLGVTSLFSDVTYQGARSLAGQFLQLLGASAFAVGAASGAGELLGYGLRFVSGSIADRTGRYWLMATAGYVVNLLAVPALALAGRWEVAVGLLFMERVGKAIRSPSRDAMLSYATVQMGRGFGFGLHEVLDQIGAFSGPLLMAGVLLLRRPHDADVAAYQAGFAMLLIPALLALVVLMVARSRFPNPAGLESKSPVIEANAFGRRYWVYLAASGLVAMGFADFPLMAYHFKTAALVRDEWIPLFYALTMAVDAVAALGFGRLFDRQGISVVALACVVSALFAPLVFWGSPPVIMVGLLLWGIGLGAQESIMRAAVANMVPPNRRATAYGMFHMGFGLCWFVGSAAMGYLYDHSVAGLVGFSVVAQLAAIPLFLSLRGQVSAPTT